MTLRAVIYCRCSTEEESQRDALAKQVKEAQECVVSQGWTLTDAYVESRSGTSTRGRVEYNRLYEDLLKDFFDVIVIKSQDRLMRNTKDWYLFVDRLTASQKKLYIYIEKKYYSPDDALITGIKAILAEDYSRELSKKINNAHLNRQKKGSAVILTNNAYGYRKGPDKTVVIQEEEAQVKRQMYQLCAAGYGSRAIADILRRDGVRNRKGTPFSDTDIRRMIRNPMNKGTIVMHRTHFDFDSKKTMKIPKEEQFVYENRIPAIVSQELWELANEKISARINKVRETPHGQELPVLGKNPGKSRLSGKLFCGLCKEPYYRCVRRKYKTQEKIYEWKCKTYLQSGRGGTENAGSGQGKLPCRSLSGCDNIHLREEKLWNLMERVCDNSHINKENIVFEMLSLIQETLPQEDVRQELQREKRRQDQISAQMDVLMGKLIDGIISDEAYQKKQKELEQNLDLSREKMRAMEKQEESMLDHSRIKDVERFLKEEDPIQRALVYQMLDQVERITIYPKYLEITFSASLEPQTLPEIVGAKKQPGDQMFRLCVEYGNTFDYLAQKKEEQEAIVERMRENPGITARQIAQDLHMSLSGVNYKIKALKKQGRIQFQGAGGKGYWQVGDKMEDGS